MSDRIMVHHPFLPYQYPVATLLVDDDTSLLDSLMAGLSAQRRVAAAHCNAEALACYAASRPPRRSFIGRSDDQTSLDQHRLVVDTTQITALIDDRSHQHEIGLLVVDHHMPGGTGMELCEALRQEPCRRILLTGAADERIAVQAFNAGLIHHYVRKDCDVLERLAEVLQCQQESYLREASASLRETLSDRLGAFEQEPTVCEALRRLLTQESIQEYYLSTSPNGLLVRDRAGRRRRILVQSEQEHRSALELLGACSLDERFATALVYAEATVGAGPEVTLHEVPQLFAVSAPSGIYRFAMKDC